MPHDPACVCVCVCARARSCAQGRVKSGLCYMITGLSLFSLHTSASLFFLPQFPLIQHPAVEPSAVTAIIPPAHSFSLPHPTTNCLMLRIL